MKLIEQVRRAGVVGAGGGGFPTHVKLSSTADTVIANGAECEPLLHKDAAIMERSATEMIRGMLLAMEAVKARAGIVGIKAKNHHAVEAVRAACAGTAAGWNAGHPARVNARATSAPTSASAAASATSLDEDCSAPIRRKASTACWRGSAATRTEPRAPSGHGI